MAQKSIRSWVVSEQTDKSDSKEVPTLASENASDPPKKKQKFEHSF